MSINSGTAGVFYEMLGLDPNKHLPTELPMRHVEGGPEGLTFLLWVTPRKHPRVLQMRLMVTCPKCTKPMSAGRWHQHNRWVHGDRARKIQIHSQGFHQVPLDKEGR